MDSDLQKVLDEILWNLRTMHERLARVEEKLETLGQPL